jgi:hypothetical protein
MRREATLSTSVKALWLVGLMVLLTAGIASAAVRSSQLVPPPAWQRAAAKLKMPVFWPTDTAGITLKQVVAKRLKCPKIVEELDGYYVLSPGSGSGNGRGFTISEGSPYYCGNAGESSTIGRPLVHGIRATLRCGWVAANRCSAETKAYPDLFWQEKGVAIYMSGFPRKRLLAVAESMQPIP